MTATGQTLEGRRVQYENTGLKLEPGDYCKMPNGHWWLGYPNGLNGYVCDKKITKDPKHHEITEHADGTITVKNSILHRDLYGKETWHGYLTKGIWSQ